MFCPQIFTTLNGCFRYSYQLMNSSLYKVHFMKSSVIVIGAHPDDIELGCGATLMKHIVDGIDVYAVVLTSGDKGNRIGYSRKEETYSALQYLGVSGIFLFDYTDTKLSEDIGKASASLEELLRSFNLRGIEFEKAYIMSREDRHQDHRAAHDISVVACRKVPQVFCYETPSSLDCFSPNLYQKIDEKLLAGKIAAIKMHYSQSHKDYMMEKRIRASAIFRGMQAGVDLCEAFVVHKMVLK